METVFFMGPKVKKTAGRSLPPHVRLAPILTDYFRNLIAIRLIVRFSKDLIG
jgi:hypothetical protein